MLEVVRGKESTLCSDTYTLPGSWPVNVKVMVTSNGEATVWVDGVEKITACNVSQIAGGGIALASESAKFDNIKVGYDTACDQGGSAQADNDIDDPGDDLISSNDFASMTALARVSRHRGG